MRRLFKNIPWVDNIWVASVAVLGGSVLFFLIGLAAAMLFFVVIVAAYLLGND